MQTRVAPALALQLLLCAHLARVDAQATLADRLFLDFLPPNGAARAVAPPSIFFAETPIVIRYTLIGGIAIYEARAACHPTALSFFGTRDAVPRAFCAEPALSILASYVTHRALRREFPAEAASYAAFLRAQSLEPVSSSRNMSTIGGWANVIGERLEQFFVDDGWNSIGDRNRDNFQMPFEDFTQYKPENHAGLPPDQLVKPLRWQPLRFAIDPLGTFATQIHVVPHIGQTVRPLVLSTAEFENRKAASPFREKDRGRAGILAADERKARMLIQQVLNRSSNLSLMQRFFAQWWNNKLVSTAGISSFYSKSARLTRFETAQQFMGEMLAQHDALLLAWKEKRRHDLARPRTLLNYFRRGSVRSFIGPENRVGNARVVDWQPLVREQPHSEFPSASAAICTAAMEHIELYVKWKRGRVAPVEISYPANSLPFAQTRAVTVRFNSPTEAAKSCGDSRLSAGVHFGPAVPAGAALARGIAERALRDVMMLENGTVPSGCVRCRGR